MRRSNRTSLDTLLRLRQTNIPRLIDELLRDLLTQVDRQETLRQLDSVELRAQRLQNLLPLPMASQRAPRRATNAVLAIQLDIERVESVAAWRKGDADGVVVVRLRVLWVDVGGRVLGLVQLEADLRKIVELRNGVARNLGLYATLEDAVQESVDVRLFCEVDEGLRVVGSLD